MESIPQTTNFRLLCRSLQIISKLSPDLNVSSDCDGVSGKQIYDMLGGGYCPDYTIFPLVLQPVIHAYDPDRLMNREAAEGNEPIRINSKLANVRWYVIENGEKKLITPIMSQYEVTTSGDNLGRIRIKRNVLPEKPVTFAFEATYLDPRNYETYHIDRTFTVECDVQEHPCHIKLDIPAQSFFNPYNKKEAVRVVNASIFIGSRLADKRFVKCIWEHRDGSDWKPLRFNAHHLFAQMSEDTMSLTINQMAMGNECVIRCLGICTETEEELAGAGAEDSFGCYSFRITRSIPEHEVDILELPHFIPPGQDMVYPRAQYNFRNYTPDDPEEELITLWQKATNKATGTLSYITIATGIKPEIPVNIGVNPYGEMIRVKSQDRGPWSALTDGSGRVLLDGNQMGLLLRPNK